jgi:class 3 adenylate cyclase
VTESPAPPASEARGFLFADLRGYTAFAEAEGDQAAADLLSAYRAIVREVIPRFEGAEIRTEGDSFYVVFRSASSAIRAGLEIRERATGSAPGRPIRVAIGVHAGEATQTAEGYVGCSRRPVWGDHQGRGPLGVRSERRPPHVHRLRG